MPFNSDPSVLPNLWLLPWLAVGSCVGLFLSYLVARLPVMLEAQSGGDDSDSTWARPGPSIDQNVQLRRLGFLGAALTVSAVTWWQCQGAPAALVAWSFFGWTLLAIAYLDWKTLWLPDVLSLSLLWGGLLFAALAGPATSNDFWDAPTLGSRVLAVAAVFLVLRAFVAMFERIRGVVGMAGGDVKLMAAFAAWFPLNYVLCILFVACLLQALVMAYRGSHKAAFGPALCFAAAGAFALSRLAS